MSSITSLETEREAILARMSSSRERYRRMLMDHPRKHMEDVYLHDESPGTSLQAHAHAAPASYTAQHHYGHSFADYRDYATPAIQFVKSHPLLCIAAVTAVVALGPRRISKAARSAVAGSGALAASTMRNQANVDLAGRLITQLVDYMQHRGRVRPPP